VCCDICPYYDECKDLDNLNENCCPECPDYKECSGEKEYQDEELEETDEY
jgi:hypothetical protein